MRPVMTEKYLKYVGKFDHALTSMKKLKGKPIEFDHSIEDTVSKKT